MRYLNYDNQSNNYELTLTHPEDLVSLSTFRVKISNINQCVNLRSLYSGQNTYNRDNIVFLKSLRRIYSDNDRYEQNDSSLLQDLFQNKNLQYVFLRNTFSDSNILNSFILRDNIEYIRCVCAYLNNNDYDIKLDVSNIVPKDLCAFNIRINNYRGQKYSII